MKKNRNIVQSIFSAFCLAFWLFWLSACSSPRKMLQSSFVQSETALDTMTAFKNCHVGFLLCDARTGAVLAEKNSIKHFIPASNTKIFTLYAAQQLLPDTLPAYRYAYGVDSVLLLRPLGYPALLHPDFEAWDGAFSFLKNTGSVINIDTSHYLATRYANGWMWDDFSYAYSAERSALPVFGNTILVFPKTDTSKGNWGSYPRLFSKYIKTANVMRPKRLPFSQTVEVPPIRNAKADTIKIPLYLAQNRVFEFLGDTLRHSVVPTNLSELSITDFFVKKGCPRDTVLRKMMYDSDNFLAEQALLMCAGTKHQDSLMDVEWSKDTLFSDWLQDCRWVDASGLSRYNLFSPEALVGVLGKMWRSQEQKELLRFFPAGGRDGTMKNSFIPKDGQPYVFAKSGSMSGVYCLSGYIRAKSGRWLVFSCMVNGYTGFSKPVREAVQELIEGIYARY